MRVIYHLVPRSSWEKAQGAPYTAPSLATEGFIHCSGAAQVAGSANRFYAGERDMVVLQIDTARLTSELRDEAASNGELFPHIYGPIAHESVVNVLTLERGADGKWQFAAPG